MPKLPGVNHQEAIRALGKAGFRIARQGAKHVVMTDGIRFLTIPRHNPVNSFTMGGIVRAAGLTIQQFKKLLSINSRLTAAFQRHRKRTSVAATLHAVLVFAARGGLLERPGLV